MKKPPESEKTVSAKRLRKKLKRKEKLALRARAEFNPNRSRRGKLRFEPTGLLSWLSRKMGEAVTRNIRADNITVRIPKTFSIISDPEGAIEALARLVSVVSSRRVRLIFFDHQEMDSYDLAAEQIIDVVAEELDRVYRYAGWPLRIGGLYPKTDEARRFLKAIGIIKHLKLAEEYLPSEEQERLEIFVAHRRQGKEDVVVGKSDRKSNETKRFVDHINKCLKRNGRSLTAFGIERLSTYTGEILANAEEHSGRGEWLLAGYLDNSTGEHSCEIAVLSFGDSFADTFIRLDQKSFARSQIEPYLRAHRSRKLFTPSWAVDDLMTLVALQGGISSRNLSDMDTRGQGTVELIGFFEKMHDEGVGTSSGKCEMAILSGHTHIRFDGKYRLGSDSMQRDVIAFNGANSLEDPPDSHYVRRLPLKFPGTVVSIKFPLQPAFTQAGASAQGLTT